MDQPRLFEPPERPLAYARAKIRAAQERALTAKPGPWSPPGGRPERTLEPMTRGALVQPVPAHGTRARYNGRRSCAPCRCAACCKANTEYIRAYRRGAADRTPMVRGPLVGRDMVDTAPLEEYGT
jgi:hypothetical protein